jgi:hypothetical protein
VGLRQRSPQLVAAEVLQIDTLKKQEVGELYVLDGAESIELKYAWD